MKRILIPLVATAAILAGCSPVDKPIAQANNDGTSQMGTATPDATDQTQMETVALKAGDKAPDLVLDGNSYNWKGAMPKMADLKGKVVVLDYWAYW
ncbi:MAG TPA: hypothetical protein VNI20_04180 [Fimbriimonadaceae bacterium]|nr:hypothetical protein [Fimbriimonadaceae bacterium]